MRGEAGEDWGLDGRDSLGCWAFILRWEGIGGFETKE